MKKTILAAALAISLLFAAPATSQDMFGWFNNLSYDQQNSRLNALESTKEMTFSATDDSFGKYLKRWLNRKGKNKSCFTGADALMKELKADPVINEEFDMKLYNTGVNVYGRSIPISHFTIKMTPKNGIGPSYMADRYLGGVLAQIIEWEEADLTEYVIEVYARVFPTTDGDFDRMRDMIVEPSPVDPDPIYSEREWLIIDALELGIGLPCFSSSLFSGQPQYCPTHDKPKGPHCTIGSTKWCHYHGVTGLEHDVNEYYPGLER